MIKENDWLVANINNPNFNISQFKHIGLSTDNTSLLDKDKYKESKYIQEAFKNPETGEFDNSKFDTYYDYVLKSYNELASNTFQDKLTDNYEYEKEDSLKPVSSKIRKLDYEIQKVINPDQLRTGVSAVNVTDTTRYTPSELAQTQKVFNWEKQEFEDYTPNDNVLFSNAKGWFKSISEPLVMAQYDQDTDIIDPNTGKTIHFKKGQYKLNEDGNYYMETLSNRSPYGKQIKSIFDSITKDTEKANKYDFMDSDSLDKSVTGSIAKNLLITAAVLPAAVNPYYAMGLIGLSLAEVLPTLYNTTIGLKTESPTVNWLDGISRSLKSGVSEYSKQNIISTENFCNLISDVVEQLVGQKAIFKGINSILGTSEKKLSKLVNSRTDDVLAQLKKSNKYQEVPEDFLKNTIQGLKNKELAPLIKRNQKIAAGVSLGYMALLSGENVFEESLAKGATPEEAALLTWLAIGGIYAVDNLGLGKWIFDEMEPDKKMLQLTSKAVANKISNDVFGETVEHVPSKNWLFSIFNKGKKASKKYWNDVKTHSLTFTEKTLTEGLEEVSEEFVVDLEKATFQLIAALGYKTNAHLDPFENMLERYGMSFVGGAIGGGMYAGHDILVNGSKPNKNIVHDLIYIIQNNKENDFLDELSKLENKGLAGNPNLGIKKVIASDGSVNYISAETPETSQNAVIANLIRNQMQVIKGFLEEENLNLSEDELIGISLARNIKLSFLLDPNNNYKSNLINDFGKISNDIVETKLKLKSLDSIQDDKKDSDGLPKNGEGKVEAKKLIENLEELRKERDKILLGEKSAYYVGEMMFGLLQDINSPFLAATFKQFAEFKSNKNYNDLNEEEINNLKERYEEYQKSQQNQDLRDSYNMFLEFNKKFSPLITENGKLYEEYGKLRKEFYDSIINFDLTKLSYINLPNVGLPERNNLDPILSKEFNTEDVNKFLVSTKKFIDKVIESGITTDEETKNLIQSYINRLDVSIDRYNNGLYKEFESTNGDPEMFEYNWTEPENLNVFLSLATDEDYKNWANENLPKLLKNIDPERDYISEIKDLQSIELNKKLRNIIKNNLNQVQENPLYKIIKSIGVSMYDKDINLFDLLKDEENKLNTLENISSYFISENTNNELDEAIKVLQMANAVITASQNFNSSKVFNGVEGFSIDGYNKTLNEFYKNQKSSEKPLGEINADLGEMMRKDLSLLMLKINYLKALSEQNRVNQVAEHKKTDQNINRIIFKTFTEDSAISNLSYNGIHLIPDITPTGNFAIDANNVLDGIHDNFQKILTDNPTVSKTVILEEIFKDITSRFSKEDLLKQNTSKLNSSVQTLTDYDLFEILLCSISFKNSDFNYYLKELLTKEEYKFAPFLSQSLAAKLCIANYLDSEVMNFGISTIKKLDSNGDLLPIYNASLINGSGGVGKTTASATLVKDICTMIDSSFTFWNAAPGEIQLNNLKTNLNNSTKDFTIENLIKHILGSADLINDLNNHSETSDYYEIKTLNINGIEYKQAIIKNGLSYNKSNNPKMIFLDEATFLNSIYAQIISNWALENNIAITLVGDNAQNGIQGYLGPDTNPITYYNIDPGNVILNRSSKLDISMRITNTQKMENMNKINLTRDILENSISASGTDILAARNAMSNLILKSYSGDDYPLNGEKLVTNTDKEFILKLLDEEEPLGYVYDDVNSSTYKIVDQLIKEGYKIDKFTTDKVQGSERKYFIIDVNTEPVDTSKVSSYISFISNLYTLASRSKEGTLFIDKGLSKVIPKEQFIKEAKTSTVPDKSASIEEFKSYTLQTLNDMLLDYTPKTIPFKEEENPTKNPIKKTPPSRTSTLLEDLENDNNEDEIIPIKGVRVYGFYMRPGIIKHEENGEIYYEKTNDNSDLNAFLPIKNENKFTQAEYIQAKKALYKTKAYLLYDKPFDDDYIEYIQKYLPTSEIAKLNKDDLNKGLYKVKISKFNKDTDIPIDKLNLDISEVKDSKFSLVYKVGEFYFTVGFLAKPDTWKKYINKLPSSKEKQDLLKKQENYEKWCNKFASISDDEVKFVDVPSKQIERNKLSRLVKTGEQYELSNFDIDNPNVLRSPMYIYAGKGELNKEEKNLNLPDNLLGKGVIFVCPDPTAEVAGEKVTSENMARLYSKQKELSKKDPNMPKPIRFITVNAKGINPIEFFNLNETNVPDGNIAKFVTTVGSIYTSANILISLWNWRANLLHFTKRIEEFKLSKGILLDTEEARKEFNEYLKSSQYWESWDDFQLMETDIENINAAPQMAIVDTGHTFGKKNLPKYGVAITEDMANTHIKVLDLLFDNIKKVIDLEEYDPKFVMVPKNKTGKTFIEKITGDENGDSISVSDLNGHTQEIPAFNFNTSYKAISLISTIFKTLFKPTYAHTWKSKDFNGNDIVINVDKLLDAEGGLSQIIDETLKNSTNKSWIKSTLTNMLGIILEGRLPEKNKKRSFEINGERLTKKARSAAPFKRGILYRSVYSFENGNLSDYEDFYPAGNAESQFTYDIAVELPVIDINFDFNPDDKNKAVKKEKEKDFKNILNHISQTIKTEYDLDLSYEINNILLEYDTKGDSIINTTIESLKNKIETTLESLAADGYKLPNNDYLIGMRDTVSGKKPITLLNEFNKVSPGTLALDNSGNVDITQISEIKKLSSNNENFLITLKNSKKLNIKYENKKLTLLQEISSKPLSIILTNDETNLLNNMLSETGKLPINSETIDILKAENYTDEDLENLNILASALKNNKEVNTIFSNINEDKLCSLLAILADTNEDFVDFMQLISRALDEYNSYKNQCNL